MILVEVRESSLQNINFMEKENNEMHSESLDLAEETIKEVHMKAKLYQRRVEKKIQQLSQADKLLGKRLGTKEMWKSQEIY